MILTRIELLYRTIRERRAYLLSLLTKIVIVAHVLCLFFKVYRESMKDAHKMEIYSSPLRITHAT